MREITIKPLDNFTSNGVLRGGIAAYDAENDSFLWDADRPNWRAKGVVEEAAQDFVAELAEFPEHEVTAERAQLLLRNGLRSARKAQAAANSEPDESPPEGPDMPTDRPMVVTSGRWIREIVVESWVLLQAADGAPPQFFRVGNNVAHLETEDKRVYTNKLRRDGLIGHLDKAANFVAVKKKDGSIKYSPDKPPKDVVDVMLAEPAPPLPRLQSVVNTPVVAPDGRVLTIDGYHPDVELYLNLNGLEVPTVPERPLPSDVDRARSLIVAELLFDFPFTSAADLAHAIAAMLTPLVRPMIDGPVPLILFEAPLPGTGKGLLVEAIVTITTGGYPAVMTEARGVEEWRKKITATLVEVPPVVLLDNITGRLDSAPLAAVLTARIWADRELGASRNIRLPVLSTFYATGNNVAMSLEIARRTVLVRIDSTQERPWERRGFKHDPLNQWVEEHRGELLWALLTLVREWVAQGRPKPSVRLGTYEAWSDVVGGVLRAVAIPGFLENRSTIYVQAEAENAGWLAFVEIWATTFFGGARVASDELFDLAKNSKLLSDLRGGRSDQGARVSFGLELAKMRDRRIGNWWVRDAGRGHGGAMTYRLETAAENDSSGESDPKKPSPPYTPYTEPHAWDGEGGEGGEGYTGSPSENNQPSTDPWDDPDWQNTDDIFQADDS